MSDELRDLLRSASVLEGIQDTTREQIASIAELVQIPAGTIVFREGETAKHIYLIGSGSISVEICAPSIGCRRILTIGEGDLLSWSPLLEQEKMTATARAMIPTTAAKIDASDILKLCEQDVQFGYDFMRRVARVLARRLNATRLQLLNIYGDSA